MNIPVEISRLQGEHGKKGGRPCLELTEEERKERLKIQKRESYHRRKHSVEDPAKMEERRNQKRESYHRRKQFVGRKRKLSAAEKLDRDYLSVWGKSPGEPLTPEEYAVGELRLIEFNKARLLRQLRRKLQQGNGEAKRSLPAPRKAVAPKPPAVLAPQVASELLKILAVPGKTQTRGPRFQPPKKRKR